MNRNQVRLSTLAEIKVLSIQTLLNFGDDPNEQQSTGFNSPSGSASFTEQLNRLKQLISDDDISLDRDLQPSNFKTVGIARQVRVDEDYGTQNIYGIGSPTRPRIVPNNFTANVTADRLQLDRRSLYDFMATPEYFYSREVQRQTGVLDGLYYTYMFIRSKEDVADATHEIYALMPRTSSKTITNGDVMVSNNVQLTGFKIGYHTPLRSLLFGEIDDITSPTFLGSGEE